MGRAATIAVPLTIHEWEARDLPEPDFISGQWLSTTSRALVVAPTGLGKTNFVMGLGLHIAAGVSFLSWSAPRSASVLLIDGEMSRRLLKKRIADAVRRLGRKPAHFRALSAEDIEFRALNTPEGQRQIDELIAERIGGDVDLIIFDNIMALISGVHKEEDGWSAVVPWTRALTRRGIGQIWVHHTGHAEDRSYGTKTREWQMDTVIHLTAVKRADTDLSFRLEFPKARERTPENRADFAAISVALVDDAWTCDAPSASDAHVTGAAKIALKLLHRCLADTGERAPASITSLPEPGQRPLSGGAPIAMPERSPQPTNRTPNGRLLSEPCRSCKMLALLAFGPTTSGSSDMPDIDGHAALSARRQPGRTGQPLHKGVSVVRCPLSGVRCLVSGRYLGGGSRCGARTREGRGIRVHAERAAGRCGGASLRHKRPKAAPVGRP